MSPVQTPTKPASTSGGGAGRGRTRIGTGEMPPEGRGPRILRALLRALPWALGAGIGVAAGAYLTATSGAGAPGASGIEPTTDLIVLPALAFAAVLVAHLLLQLVWSALRRSR